MIYNTKKFINLAFKKGVMRSILLFQISLLVLIAAANANALDPSLEVRCCWELTEQTPNDGSCTNLNLSVEDCNPILNEWDKTAADFANSTSPTSALLGMKVIAGTGLIAIVIVVWHIRKRFSKKQ